MKSLARKLNADKVAKPVRTDIKPGRGTRLANTELRSNIWTADTLKDILNNRRYVGKIPRNDGTEHDATFAGLPAGTGIIDNDTWKACVRQRASATKLRNVRGVRQSSPYLLSGVLRCKRCGSTMSGERRPADRSHAPRYMYTCYRRRVARECDLPYLRKDRLEQDLIDVLRAIALPPAWLKRSTQRSRPT
jgi:site-specific DNA recombinase